MKIFSITILKKKHYRKVFRCCETAALRLTKNKQFPRNLAGSNYFQSINPSSSTKEQVAIAYLSCNVIKSFATRNQ